MENGICAFNSNGVRICELGKKFPEFLLGFLNGNGGSCASKQLFCRKKNSLKSIALKLKSIRTLPSHIWMKMYEMSFPMTTARSNGGCWNFISPFFVFTANLVGKGGGGRLGINNRRVGCGKWRQAEVVEEEEEKAPLMCATSQAHSTTHGRKGMFFSCHRHRQSTKRI